MEMEVEVSLMGDDTYSRVVSVNVPFNGEGGKRYINLVLNLVREAKKEDEEEEEEVTWRGNRRSALLCESKKSRKRKIGFKELEQIVFANKAVNGKWKNQIKKDRR